MAEKRVKLSKTKGEVEVEIVIGFAQFGKYRFSLSTPDNTAFTIMLEGDNADSRPDRFIIPLPVAALHDRLLRWKVIIASFDIGPGAFYSVSVKIRQNGANVAPSPIQDSGPLDGVKIVEDEVRLIVS